MTEASITLDPDPPVAGAKLTICKVGGTLPGTGTLTWEPDSITEPDDVAWPESGCIEITCPDTATNIQVEDDAGEAPYRDVPVVPPT